MSACFRDPKHKSSRTTTAGFFFEARFLKRVVFGVRAWFRTRLTTQRYSLFLTFSRAFSSRKAPHVDICCANCELEKRLGPQPMAGYFLVSKIKTFRNSWVWLLWFQKDWIKQLIAVSWAFKKPLDISEVQMSLVWPSLLRM
jgi:hypothetical protein